jgi:hypothetical protein
MLTVSLTRRRLLLGCYAQHQEICTTKFLDHRMVSNQSLFPPACTSFLSVSDCLHVLITSRLTLVGNWTVTTSINFSGAQLILSAISLWKEDFVPNAWQTVLMFWCVMLICMLLNIFGSKYLDLFNKICIYWTGASVIIIMVVLLAMSDNYRSAEFVFAHYDASDSGWPSGWAFFVGLLQASYTLTGYGMVAAMCEEVQVSMLLRRNLTGKTNMVRSESRQRGAQGNRSICRCCRCYRCSVFDPNPFRVARRPDASGCRQWSAYRSFVQASHGLGSWWLWIALPAPRYATAQLSKMTLVLTLVTRHPFLRWHWCSDSRQSLHVRFCS